MPVEILSSFLNYFSTWISLIIAPFSNFELLWGVIPLYMEGVISVFYEEDSPGRLLMGGGILSFIALDWARRLFQQGIYPSLQIQWMLVFILISYGILSLILVLKKTKGLIRMLGKRKLVVFFALSFYPLQSGMIPYSDDVLISILVMLVPIWLILELILYSRKNPIEL